MTPDAIAALSPGELQAMKEAHFRRRREAFDEMALAVAVGIGKAFSSKE